MLPQKNLSSQESEKSQHSEQNKILISDKEEVNNFDVPHFEDLPEIDGQEADQFEIIEINSKNNWDQNNVLNDPSSQK